MSGSPVLYSLTLQRPSAINAAVVGQFKEGSKTQQIILARGSWLELLRPDPESGKLVLIYRVNVLATVRALANFKIAGAGKDYILMTSDSGKISSLGYDSKQNKLVLVNQESFGKSGVRRTVPGEYLACDPKGRATMIAAIEKTRLVYVLNRAQSGDLTMSSPLENSASKTLLYDLVGMDVGYENPVFACLEATYSDDPAVSRPPQKRVALYELDLGLNHILHKWSQPVDFSAAKLVAIPGGNNGPSGALICSDGKLRYAHPNQESLEVVLPSSGNAQNYVISAVMHKLGDSFFVLLQDSQGVLFKLSFFLSEEDVASRWGGRKAVVKLELQQFGQSDPSFFLAVFKAGFLFCATIAGDHLLYQFNTLGEEDSVQKFTSDEPSALQYEPVELENITLLDQLHAINPVLSSAVLNLRKDETPQIYAACGRGKLSSIRALEYGLEVSELINSPLPAEPLGVFTTKCVVEDEFDRYIVISFATETLVLAIGDEVTEVSDSGLVKEVATLAVQQVGNSSLIQAHAKGLVHITKDKTITEWKPPGEARIIYCSANNNQVLLALSNQELVYFESDADGMLIEYSKREKMPAKITSIAVGPVPKGRIRSLFAAVGCKDETVRLISLDLGSTLETLSIQGLSAPAASVGILESPEGLNVHIGLQNGVYITTMLDTASGDLTDTKTRFLGPAAVHLGYGRTLEDDYLVAIALCTKPWLTKSTGRDLEVVPLTYPALKSISPFSSPDCPKGAVAVSKSSLSILQIERKKENVHYRTISLDETPRRMITNSMTPYLYTLCSGVSRSSIKVVDATKAERVLGEVDLGEKAASLGICNCRFQSRGKEYLVVSTVKDANQRLGAYSSAQLQVYEYAGSPFGTALELVHTTIIAAAAHVLVGYKGMLLAGTGNALVLFDMGKKQLLRRGACILENAREIRALAVTGDRIVVGDGKHSVTFVKFEKNESNSGDDGPEITLTPFADESIARSVTALAILDYDTVAVADKFGNVAVLRCPKSVPLNMTSGIIKNKDPIANGCPYKLELVCHFYTGDVPIGLHKATLTSGGFEAIIWLGISGTVGAFLPILSSQDAKFFSQLEQQMRRTLSMASKSNLAGRDHLTFRGYYAPPKQVIDGDLCEIFSSLSKNDQDEIGEEFDRNPQEIARKLMDLRNRSVF